MKQPEKWIFDNDGGLDDAYALVLLLSKPDIIKIEAITVVGGNVNVDTATKANVRTLEICKTKIPVYAGANEGIVQPPNFITNIHGTDGQGDAPEYKSLIGYVDCIKTDMHAAQAIVKTVNENSGDISIIATGPLTNVALATKLDPEIPKKIKRFVVMGGAHYATGNSSWAAEFNFHGDPEAAEICVKAIPFVEILTVENGNNFVITPEDMKKWFNTNTERGKFLNCISQQIIRNSRFGRVFCYDAIAASIAIDPSVIKDAIKANCKIELHGYETRGMLVINWAKKRDYKIKDTMPLIVLDTYYEKVIKLFIGSTNL